MRAERNICVQMFNHKNQPIGRVRRYKGVDTAAKRQVELMMLEGKVKYVSEMFHAVTGMHLGSVLFNAKGHLVVRYVWER